MSGGAVPSKVHISDPGTLCGGISCLGPMPMGPRLSSHHPSGHHPSDGSVTGSWTMGQGLT